MTLPEEFTTYTRALMGEERFARFLGALDEPAPVSIRVNPFKAEATPETGADRVAWCRGGYYLDSRPAFTFDPLLHAGAYYVQEASSMFIDHVVRQFVHAPVTALDLCAAPGGKTTCLRAALPDTAHITATAFDVPQKDSIHAYYCNRDTEKWGKIVLFQPFSPCQGHLFKSP